MHASQDRVHGFCESDAVANIFAAYYIPERISHIPLSTPIFYYYTIVIFAGGRTLCYKMGSGRVCAKHQHPWKSYPITVPTPLYPINMDVNVEDGICFNIPPFVRRC